jgi:hypothetical protein
VPYAPAVVIDMTARRPRGRRSSGRSPLAASSGIAAVLVLGLLALAGCTSEDEPRAQYIAFCQGSLADADDAGGEQVQVEFRQGSTVVAKAITSAGGAFTAEVPIGEIQIYVDDVKVGAANEGVDLDTFPRSPAPDEVIYLTRGEGCPDSPPPGVPSS